MKKIEITFDEKGTHINVSMTVTNYITPANIDKASDIVDKITDKIIEKINKRDK